MLPLLLVGALTTSCATMPERPVLDLPESATRMRAVATAGTSPNTGPELGLGGVSMAETPEINDPALQRELDRIAARLRRGLPVANFPQIRVVATASREYGAELDLRNQIVVTLGMLVHHDHEDQAAFVIGHEMGHRLLGHRDSRQASLLGSRNTIRLGTMAVTYGIAQSVQNQRLRQGDQRRTAVAGTVMMAPVLDTLAAEITDSLYARAQETEADRIGFDLMLRAGYTPGAAGSVFEALQANEQAREARVANLRGTVANALSTMAIAGGQQAGGSAGGWAQILGPVVAPVLERGFGNVLGPLSQRYDPLLQRQASHVAYEEKHHAEADTPEATPSPFRRGVLGQRLTERMRVLELLDRAEAAMRQANTSEAASLMRDRGAVTYGGARRLLVLASIGLIQNNVMALSQALNAAVNAPDATASTYISIAAMWEDQGNTRNALNALDIGERRYGSGIPFLAHRARIFRRAGDQTALQAVMERCRQTGIPEVESACAAAGQPPPSSSIASLIPTPAAAR